MNKNFPLILYFYLMSFLMMTSVQNWFMLWVSMELNTFSFLVLMSEKNMMKKDNLILYFSIQTISSLMLLITMLITEMKMNMMNIMPMMLGMAILLKMGAAPLHHWVLPVGSSLSKMSMLVFLTAQKIFPFLFLKTFNNIYMFIFIFMFWSSLLWGALQNMNQILLKNIIIFSSVSHLGWLMMSMIKISTWEFYFIFYCLISTLLFNLFKKNMKFFNQMKKNNFLFLLFMTLGGMPPLMGFFPKLNIIEMNYALNMTFVFIIIVFFSIFDLFVYTRLSMSNMFWKNYYMLWNSKIKMFYKMFMTMNVMIILSIMV